MNESKNSDFTCCISVRRSYCGNIQKENYGDKKINKNIILEDFPNLGRSFLCLEVFMILDAKINAFLKSPVGKKKVAEAKAVALKEGRVFGQLGGSISMEDAKVSAEKMRAILVEKLSEIADVGVLVGEPVIDAYGNITIDINFDPGTLHRDSLYQEDYPNGVD